MKRRLVAPKSGTNHIDLPPNPGGEACIDARNNIAIKDSKVRFVGIANLAEVVDYRIVAIYDSVSHYIRFCNGGELYYVFNRRGEVVELTGRTVCCSVSSEGDYLFWTFPEPQPAS
jgi:hypothetical protein